MEKLKFAVVGCGRISHRHVEHINNYGELVAVCDIVAVKAKNLAEKNNCNYYLSFDEMLQQEKDFDVLVVATPNGLHAEHSIKGLKFGHHVLCEKPMALNVHDCEEMIHEAEKVNKRLFVVKQNRFNPPIQTLKSLLDEQRLGKIFSIQLNCFWNRNEEYYRNSDWKGTKLLDGGTLFTQFSHFIDLLYWLFGNIESVNAYFDNYQHEKIIEFEDTGVVILRFKSGIIGTINYTVNSYKQNYEGSLTIFGEKGTVKVGGQYLNVLEYQKIEDHIIDNIPESSPANNYGYYQGSMSNHSKVYENLIDVLTYNGRITTNFLDGLKTVQIIEKIYAEGKF